MNEIQKRILDIFSCFHDICEDNGLKYYACSGTMLGAVRHKGFIPWDDDMDVMMPRPDFEKFKLIASKKHGHYIFEAPGCNRGNYYYSNGKYFDASTTVIEEGRFCSKRGVFLDVFPLDGLGNTEAELIVRYKFLHFFKRLIDCRVASLKKEKGIVKNALVLISRIIPEFVLDTQKLREMFDNSCAKYRFDSSKYVGVIAGSYGMRDVIERSLLDDPKLYDFETVKIWGVSNYDKYLSGVYGDWRQLPPVENRKTGHNFIFVDLNTPYLDDL